MRPSMLRQGECQDVISGSSLQPSMTAVGNKNELTVAGSRNNSPRLVGWRSAGVPSGRLTRVGCDATS